MNRPQRATRNNVAKAFVPGGVISSFTGVPQNQPAQPVLPVTAPTVSSIRNSFFFVLFHWI